MTSDVLISIEEGFSRS